MKKEVHRTFHCEDMKVSSLTLLKEKLILQLQKKIRERTVLGEQGKQNYGFCSEIHSVRTDRQQESFEGTL